MKLFRKIATIFAAAALMAGLAGNAMAAIADGDLIRVIYRLNQTTGQATYEMATNLGSGAEVSAITGSNISRSSINSSDVLSAIGAQDWSDLYVTYLSMNSITRTALLSNTANAGPDFFYSNQRSFGSFHTAFDAITNYYNANTTLAVDAQGSNSYWNIMDHQSTGSSDFGSFISSGAMSTEASLADLAAGGIGYVDQGLYSFVGSGGAYGAQTIALRTLLRTDSATGITYLETVVNPSAVPIPPAFFLMGSGLIGMIGVRRRMAQK